MAGVHWSDEIVDWIKRRFPEIASTPFYLRMASEMPNIEHFDNALAFTSTGLDCQMQSVLEERNEWHGRGVPVIVQDVGYFFSKEWMKQVGIILHETSHWFDGAGSRLRKPREEWCEYDLEVGRSVDEFCHRHGFRIDQRASELISHGPTFGRAGLHCWFRCRREIDLRDMLILDQAYESPSPELCIESLRAELESTTNIVEVMKTPMPEAYVDLWRNREEGDILIKLDAPKAVGN
jgi:hypothetical protein